ncbi:hypothetical protein PIB30_027890 [Stylosanthes scabra]|uniref:Uncharacterized protein n=1 Tax=Stylosanthes scabra TaxID=79078 RepID=A0ABU6XAH3_9FABA|nr:hypothetical protein [Stylosanthes scabra]
MQSLSLKALFSSTAEGWEEEAGGLEWLDYLEGYESEKKGKEEEEGERLTQLKLKVGGVSLFFLSWVRSMKPAPLFSMSNACDAFAAAARVLLHGAATTLEDVVREIGRRGRRRAYENKVRERHE